MGLLLIGVLAGILIGFGLLGPSQGHFQGCTWQGCFDTMASSQPLEPKPAALRPDPPRVQAKASAAAKSGKRSSLKPRRRIALAKEPAPPTRIRITVSDARPAETSARAAETSDPVLSKAKATVAAKMEVPSSAEFSDLDRAIRLNTLGRPVDTICGHVRGKNASGGDTGEKPFLYLVKEDDAYVVDGKAESAATIAYRNICH